VPVELNHTIVFSHDKATSAAFAAEVLGLGEPHPSGPFLGIETTNGVTLDFMDVDADQKVGGEHYAFLVSEQEFDEIFARLGARGVEHFADPAGQQPGRINTNDGGRGCYFFDPDGHWLEILTRPYGSGGS